MVKCIIFQAAQLKALDLRDSVWNLITKDCQYYRMLLQRKYFIGIHVCQSMILQSSIQITSWGKIHGLS